MLEMSVSTLEQSMSLSNEMLSYPQRIEFSCGEVVIEWDEQQSCFHLTAYTSQGHRKTDEVYLETVLQND